MTRARDVANIDGILTTTGDMYVASAAATPARLGIGSTGQVLTVAGGTASWATASSGGITELATGTLSGASVNVTGLSGSYKDLYIVLVNYKPATSNARCDIRFNADSSVAYFTNQTYGIDANGNDPNANELRFATNQYSGFTQGLATMRIPFYSNSTTWKIASIFAIGNNNANPTTGKNSTVADGYWYNTNAITQINFISSTGNFTSGTYYIYGVK